MVGIAAAIVGFFVIAAILIKLIAGGSGFSLGGGGGNRSNGNATPINLTNYRENANSLRGNVYKIEGKIEEMLRFGDERGRLISFDAVKEGSDGEVYPVPVLVPDEFRNVNLERGAEMSMIVRVNPNGMLVAESIDR